MQGSHLRLQNEAETKISKKTGASEKEHRGAATLIPSDRLFHGLTGRAADHVLRHSAAELAEDLFAVPRATRSPAQGAGARGRELRQ